MSNFDVKAELKDAKARVKALQPWYQKKRYWVLGIVLISFIFSVISQQESPNISLNSTNGSVATSAKTSEPKTLLGTVSQINATRKAKSYLDMAGFSRSGLVNQLEFEGFSTSDATYGADAQNANWNEQAARKAKSYLDMAGFSRSGLIDQLVYEGFSQQEASYGASANGL